VQHANAAGVRGVPANFLSLYIPPPGRGLGGGGPKLLSKLYNQVTRDKLLPAMSRSLSIFKLLIDIEVIKISIQFGGGLSSVGGKQTGFNRT
jgi:hypothetical protein